MMPHVFCTCLREQILCTYDPKLHVFICANVTGSLCTHAPQFESKCTFVHFACAQDHQDLQRPAPTAHRTFNVVVYMLCIVQKKRVELAHLIQFAPINVRIMPKPSKNCPFGIWKSASPWQAHLIHTLKVVEHMHLLFPSMACLCLKWSQPKATSHGSPSRTQSQAHRCHQPHPLAEDQTTSNNPST